MKLRPERMVTIVADIATQPLNVFHSHVNLCLNETILVAVNRIDCKLN